MNSRSSEISFALEPQLVASSNPNLSQKRLNELNSLEPSGDSIIPVTLMLTMTDRCGPFISIVMDNPMPNLQLAQ